MSTAVLHAELCIPADHPSLPGHFPGNPVVPGVVLLDRVAAAVETTWSGRIAALPQAKFLAPLLPHQVAQLEITQIAPTRLRFRISRDAAPIASGEVELT
jgi:3-hydroxymyristoyl/3-hydroxydecanoyl-(acyl carrier protein) dehydratase